MVTVTFTRDSRQRLSSFSANGHSGWADAGEDIVCAAASAILQAALLGLLEHAKIAVDARRSTGALTVAWPEIERGREDVAAIVATAELAIATIARQYPDHVALERAVFG